MLVYRWLEVIDEKLTTFSEVVIYNLMTMFFENKQLAIQEIRWTIKHSFFLVDDILLFEKGPKKEKPRLWWVLWRSLK